MESEQGQEEHAEGPSVLQERLNWRVACRDDAKVAAGLYAGEAIEEMHELSDAGMLDEFCVFLEEVGILRAFEQVSVPGVKRVLVPTVQFVLLYFLKVLFGSESMHELPRVLISSLALMEVVGFNAKPRANGLTKRGDAQRQSKKNQGPITAQCLAENSSKLNQEEREALFHQMVHRLVGWGLLSGERLVALDGSNLPTPASYEGCGKLNHTRQGKVKGQQEPVTQEYYVEGWKVLVLMDVETGLPLALKLVSIQAYEGRWLVPLLAQAQRNLGPHAPSGTIVVDRG
jgi:hypothetical protein